MGFLFKDIMNVRELREILADYPDEMEILTTRYSDYQLVEACDLSVVKAVIKDKGWVTRYHPSMRDELKDSAKHYFHIAGN